MAEEMMTKAAAMPNRARMTMVERVARAIYDAWASENEVTHTWDEMVAAVAISSAEDAPTLHRMHRLAFAEARAAIEAMREPTDAMKVAGVLAWEDEFFGQHGIIFDAARRAWGASVNAALSEAENG